MAAHMEKSSKSKSQFSTRPVAINTDSGSLVDSVGFDLIGSDLGKDLESSLQIALTGGAIFINGNDPVSIFRRALSASIREIESHPRGRLFQEFLLKGSYEDVGEIPRELVNQRLGLSTQN